MKKRSTIIIGGIVIIGVLIATYFYVDGLLFDGVKPRPITENGFQANFFATDTTENQPTVILIGGGDWGDYWGQAFGRSNYAALSLPYLGREGVPELIEEIPLEYFQKAISWLKEQPEVNPDKIVVMGASRNAELALVIASYLPESVHGVIAYSPSSVSWSNAVHPFNSYELKPSWTYENQAVPFIPTEKLKGSTSNTVETLSYWKRALSDSAAVRKASIKVENIQGPILLFSGLDDEVWPAAVMSDMMENRIDTSAFNFIFENIQYENAGHLISGNPNFASTTRYGKMTIDGKNYDYGFGGTVDGDIAAQKDASKRVFEFLSKLRNE